MRPVEFKHQNIVFAKDQPEYQPLPALRIHGPKGEVISCWKMSLKERLKVLFSGRVWLSLMSFNQPLTPSYLAVNRKEVYSHSDDEKTILSKIRKHFTVQFTLKECFYIFPCICNTAFVFLFIRVEIPRISKKIAWLTPFFAVQYMDGLSIWIGWLNGGLYYEGKKIGTCSYGK